MYLVFFYIAHACTVSIYSYVHVVHDRLYEIRATTDFIDKPIYWLMVNDSILNIKVAPYSAKFTVIMS